MFSPASRLICLMMNPQCEGRHLASAELKCLLALMLSNFDITPLFPTQGRGPPLTAEATKIDIKGASKMGIAPSRALGRPGLGAFQFDGSDVIVNVTRKARLSVL